MLTRKQIKDIWNAGNWDEYTNELLLEQAKDYVSHKYPNLKDEDIQIALEIYTDGFCGTNAP